MNGVDFENEEARTAFFEEVEQLSQILPMKETLFLEF